MSGLRCTYLGVLAVLAVSIAMTATASAAVFELTKVACTGATTTFCWESETEPKEGLLELKGEQTFAVAIDPGTETLLTSKLGAEELHITCAAVAASGTPVLSQPEPLVKPPTASFKLKFTGCKLLAPLSETCKVEETLETEIIAGAFPINEEVQFKPAAGEGKPFITIDILPAEGKVCLNEDKQPVTGKQKCLWATPEEDKVVQLLICLPTESELKFGTKNAAEFLLEADIDPSGLNNLWDIAKG